MKFQYANHANQFLQLAKLNPAAHAKAAELLHQGMIDGAKKVIYAAMVNLLQRQNKPLSLWELVNQAIETGNIPTASNRQVRLTKDVSLYCRLDGYICLYGLYTQSRPIVYQGQATFDHNSGNVGQYKLTSEAKVNFDKWQQEINV